MDVGDWLRGLGLERYEQAFRDNDIDADVLPELTADDLTGLGITSVGHRRKLLAAIAALGSGPAPSGVAAEPSIDAPPAMPSTEAERRQLTVMFVDLVGSTALATRVDPEDLREVVGAYHRRVAAGIERFGGFVAKYMGDGVLAYFGWPKAQEDEAERAVRAGLGLVAGVRELASPTGTALRVRVGIATGLAVVGDRLGSGAAQEQAVVGETPNLAARLQALAEPDSVVIAATTRRLVGDLFECADLGAVEAKGFAEPVQAYRVLGTSAVESRFEAFHAGAALAPLVGREEELELLQRRWRQATGGEGRVVLLSGEPGIGKSRLLAALQERLAAEPHVALRYFCAPHRQDSAFHPIIAQLERAAVIGRDDPAPARLAKLDALLARTAPPAEDVALLAELLSIPGGDRYPAPPLTPQRKRERTFTALLRQLEGLAHDAEPVLMTFEDVHWIDPSSRELLDLTVERVARLPILLLVAFRREFGPPWVGQPHVTEISLSRLGRREAAALVRRVAGRQALPDNLVEEIVERADGVPLFVEELTKAVVEAGAGEAAGLALARTSPAALGVPATLHASLMARLDRLGPAARELAQIGAVIGREFDFPLLAAVAGRDGVALSGALDRLAGAGLVLQRGTPPEATYLFKHALVRDAAYGSLLRSRRQELHRRIVAELARVRSDTPPELLADHCAEAGLTEEAVDHLRDAGSLAASKSAISEAIAHFTRGLRLVEQLDDGPGRNRREMVLQAGLGAAYLAGRGYAASETGRAFTRARDLGRQLADNAWLGPVLYGLFIHHHVRADFSASRATAEELAKHGQATGDTGAELVGRRCTGFAELSLGDLASSRKEFEASLALYDPQVHRGLAATYALDPAASGRSLLSLTLFMLGYAEQADWQSREAVAVARDHPHSHTYALCIAGTLATLRGDAAATQIHAGASVAVAVEQGFPLWRGQAAMLHGWALAVDRDPAAGLAEFQHGLAMWRATGAEYWAPFFWHLLADIHVRAGRAGEALAALSEAKSRASRTRERWYEAELHRAEGELRRLAGAPGSEVEVCFTRALAVARQQAAKSFELRAATSLARLWRDQGRRDAARDLLAPIFGWFTEGFGTPDLVEAKALLRELT